MLGSAADGDVPPDPAFHLARPVRPGVLDGIVFHALLPARVARELREFEPDAVLVHGAHDALLAMLGRRLARSSAPVVVDLHGDWRTTARLYGSRVRSVTAPVVDLVSRLAIKRADAVRTVSQFTTELVREEGVEPTAEFAAFVDFDEFRVTPPTPLPARTRLLFVGVLEQYKGVDVLADAWRLAAPRVPDAELHLVGRGSRFDVVEQLLVDVPRQTSWHPALPQAELVHELDRSTALVLPSRSEGLPRIVLEAFCRGRPVVAARSGGIPDAIRDGENGILVEPESAEALADAIVELLVEPDWAAQLGRGAASSAQEWLATPEEYAGRVRDLVASLD